MLLRKTLLLPALLAAASIATRAATTAARDGDAPDLFARLDSFVLDGHTVAVWSVIDTITPLQSMHLTDKDYREVAERLGVEPAAIKAVVAIEAGKTHQGFWKEGMPLINFDLKMFEQFAARNKVNLSEARKTSPVIFSRPNDRRYGSRQAAQQARLDAAMTVDKRTAVQGTFWGMFQIGGFNWKKCGTESVDDFITQMSRSERSQLDLFANFIENTGLLKSLRAKDWSSFARGYNGPKYASRGYHTRLAAAYKRYKAQE